MLRTDDGNQAERTISVDPVEDGKKRLLHWGFKRLPEIRVKIYRWGRP
jgi:hypothetical protein